MFSLAKILSEGLSGCGESRRGRKIYRLNRIPARLETGRGGKVSREVLFAKKLEKFIRSFCFVYRGKKIYQKDLY